MIDLLTEVKLQFEVTPFARFDFSGLEKISPFYYDQLINCALIPACDAIVWSLKSIIQFTSNKENPSIEGCLEANFDKNGEKIEYFNLARTVFNFLSEYPITIRIENLKEKRKCEEMKEIALNEEPAGDELIRLEEAKLIKQCVIVVPVEIMKDDQKMSHYYIPLDYENQISEKIVRLMCEREMRALKKAISSPAKINNLEFYKLESEPLRLSYSTATALLLMACGSESAEIKISDSNSSQNLYKLRFILAMPTFLKNVAHAIFLAQELKICTNINIVNITIKDGSPISPSNAIMLYIESNNLLYTKKSSLYIK